MEQRLQQGILKVILKIYPLMNLILTRLPTLHQVNPVIQILIIHLLEILSVITMMSKVAMGPVYLG